MFDELNELTGYIVDSDDYYVAHNALGGLTFGSKDAHTFSISPAHELYEVLLAFETREEVKELHEHLLEVMAESIQQARPPSEPIH